VIAFPGIVSGGLAKKAAVNTEQIQIEVPDAATPADEKAQDSLDDALDKALEQADKKGTKK
jgi:hypothetical protein